MKRYRVWMTQRVTEEATVYVEADSREQAQRRAIELANHGQVAWDFLGAPDPVEVVTVDEMRTL